MEGCRGLRPGRNHAGVGYSQSFDVVAALRQTTAPGRWYQAITKWQPSNGNRPYLFLALTLAQ